MATDLLAGERVLGFDVETTGLDHRRHRIIQYALVGAERDGTAVRIEELVHPQRRIPRDATRVHGMTDEDVAEALPFAEHAAQLAELIEGTVLVGHNVVAFDWPFIQAELRRVGQLVPKPRALVDTLLISRRLALPGKRNLGELCARYGIELVDAHTAGADAAATLLLLWRLMEDHPAPFRQPLEELERWQTGSREKRQETRLGPMLDDLPPLDARGRVRRSSDGLVLAFGRHRGRMLAVVAEEDPGYLRWLLSPSGGLEGEARAEVRELFEPR